MVNFVLLIAKLFHSIMNINLVNLIMNINLVHFMMNLQLFHLPMNIHLVHLILNFIVLFSTILIVHGYQFGSLVINLFLTNMSILYFDHDYKLG